MGPPMDVLSKLPDSVRLFRAQPWMSLAVGSALVVALASVCCGLGALAAPWFGCELFATQIAAATGRRPPRTRAWLGAGLFLFGAVAMVASTAWLATLGLGHEMPVDDAFPAVARGELWAVALSVGGAVLALVFIVPFLYTPIVLVDRGGSIGGAALESARLVITGGALRHFALSLLSHVVQAAPVLVAASAAALFAGSAELPWAVLAAVPLLALTIPLGQGMIVAAWIEQRDRLVDPARTRREGRPPRALAIVLTAVLLAPAVATGLVVLSLARPSTPRAGAAPAGEVLVDAELAPGETRRIAIPTTSLDLHIEGGWVSVEVADGGGVGRLPRPDPRPVERVRVVRVRDAFAIEAHAGDGRWVTWVSRAGVRLDDDLRARLADRLPPEALVVVALALLLTPILVGRVLVRLAEVRRLAAEGDAAAREHLSTARGGARRAGWTVAAAVAPLAVAALVVGLLALLGP